MPRNTVRSFGYKANRPLVSFVSFSHLAFSFLLLLSGFRTCVLCVVVLERVRRGSCLLVLNVPSVTILTV